MKKTISILLSLLMILLTIPAYSTAAPAADSLSSQSSETNPVSFHKTYINPLYEDVLTEADLVKGEALGESDQAGGAVRPESADRAEKEEYYFTVEDAGTALREGMKNREETITVPFATADDFTAEIMDTISDEAFKHTGRPTEGDYLYWQFGGWDGSLSYTTADGINYITMTYTVTYYTTASQESQVDKEVAKVLKDAPISGSNEYRKIKYVYDYVTHNVSYDYDNLEDDSYKLKYTAYAALIDHKAVCQGYSLLMYRLLLECGVDCRMISGTGKNEKHGWNIIKVGDHYYNADATWDSSYYKTYGTYTWFLRGTDNFADHVRKAEYSTDEFNTAYPMSSADYSGHSLTMAEGKAATFDNPGYSVYWICDDCRLLFSDAEGINQTTKEDLLLPATAKLSFASLRLSGDVGVNFFYRFSEEVAQDPSTRVIIKVGNGSEQTFKVSDAVIDTKTMPGTTLYGFTCYVMAKQMTDVISIHVESDTQSGSVKTYSVRKYADKALSQSGTSDKLKYLVRVMMHYGSAAQTYLNYNLSNPADEGLDNADILEVCNALKASDLEAYKTQRTEMPDGISIYAANLSLESETVLRYHFEVAEGHSIDEYTFTVDGKKYDPVLINGRYCIEIRNILAKDIDKMFTVVVTDQAGASGSISYGVLSYVRSVLKLEGTDNEKPALSAVGRSLYVYNLASKDYLGV